MTGLTFLINNAGILKSPNPRTDDDLDIRYVVNTFAPYLLTKRLLPLMNSEGRIVNLSSAAQAAVDFDVLAGSKPASDMDAYSQSKLAITMWSIDLAGKLPDGPSVLAVNPGSLLASKMVKEGFGIQGNDLSIGANLLYQTALVDEFQGVSGRYYDNDAGRFGDPFADALNPQKRSAVVEAIETIVGRLTS